MERGATPGSEDPETLGGTQEASVAGEGSRDRTTQNLAGCVGDPANKMGRAWKAG